MEVITAWPGLGRLTFDALIARDTALVAGCAAVTSTFVSVAALVSDLVVAWADPRGGTPRETRRARPAVVAGGGVRVRPRAESPPVTLSHRDRVLAPPMAVHSATPQGPGLLRICIR